MIVKHLVMLSVVLLLAERASAHDFWIEPATYRPAAGQPLAIRFMQGEHFRGEPVARNDARIEKFVIRGALGERAVGGKTGDEPAGRVERIAAGEAIVGYRTRPLRHGRMAAARFESYLREEGLERVIALRAGRGHAKRAASEMYSRSAKSLLVPAGAGSIRFDEVLGFRFEIVPETDPHDRSRATLTLRLLFEGRPVPGVLVTAMHRDNASLTVRERSNGEGRVTLRVAEHGVWLVKAVQMIEAPQDSGVDWESIWATLTFEKR